MGEWLRLEESPAQAGSPGAGFMLNLMCFTDDKATILQESTLVSLLQTLGPLQQISLKLISPSCFLNEKILYFQSVQY